MDGKKRPRFRLEVKRSTLKWYGCVTMLFYTAGMAVFQNGLLHVGQYTREGLALALKNDPGMMALSGWALGLQLLGALAVPVFAFLLSEGFRHTSDFRKYLLRVLAFALLSEIPYDFAMSGTPFDPSRQNGMFTLAVCLVMMYGLRLLSQPKPRRAAQIAVIAAALLWCGLLRCAFGMCTVLLCAVYELLYDRKSLRVLIGCGVSTLYITAPLSGWLFWNYAGETGKRFNKYVFYAFYPLHLLLFGAVARLLAG